MKPSLLLLTALACATASCQAPRDAGPIWWAERTVEKGRVHHVITGGILTDRHSGVPMLELRIPADWRSAPRRVDEEGTQIAEIGEVEVAYVQGEEKATYQPERSVIVGPYGGPYGGYYGDGQSAWLRTLPKGNVEVYLIDETQGQEQLHVEVFGLDGWPRVPIRVAQFDWAVTGEEIAGWQESVWMRGPVQVGIAVGTVVGMAYLIDGGFEKSVELSQ